MSARGRQLERVSHSARALAAAFRKPGARKLPLQHGSFRITGDTLEGPRETDSFEVVSDGSGDISVVLLDIGGRHGSLGDVGRALLTKARQSLSERTPLHAVMLDLVRTLFTYPGTELRVTLVRCSEADARIEVTTAGMPLLACVHPDGHISIHSTSAPPLTSTTTLPPAVEVVPLVWGSTWLAVSDGFTAGSDHPDAVHRLALDLDLPGSGLALSAQAPDSLYDWLANRVFETGRFSRDDATLILIGADPRARQSGVQRGARDPAGS